MSHPSMASCLLLFVLLLSSGCTMDITLPVPAQKAQSVTSNPTGFQFQRASSAPRNTLRNITEKDLRPGDLMLSSNIGLTSVGIRVFSTSAVSHVALYIGQGEVAEAVGSGVQIVTLKEAMEHSDKIFALRMADLTDEDAEKIRIFAQQKAGSRYNYAGIIELAPFMLTKQLCSLNPFSKEFRQQCVKGMAAAQLRTPTGNESRYFCSEFVLEAYKQTGHPLTAVSSNWVSPGDLLHMREGDIATLSANKPLVYVGHLKQGIYLKARERIKLN